MDLSTNPLFTHGIDKLCTICHVILTGTDTSQSIFSTLEELESPMNVLQVLQSFSNFNCYNGAEMVCTTCYGKTIEVYKFIQMCNKAHDHMQHYLKNIEAIKTIKDETDVNIKLEEISIEPTRIIIDGREFLEQMENEKISKTDEMEIVISGTEIKIEQTIRQGIMEKEETRMNEEITISRTEIVTEGKTDSSNFDHLKAEKNDAQLHDDRMDVIKCKDCHLVFTDKKELGDHQKEAKHINEKPFFSETCNSFFETKYNLRSHDQRYNAKRAHISEDLNLNQDRHRPLRDHEIDLNCSEHQEVFYNDKKKFMCNDCGKVFTTKDYLNIHNLVHAGEKPVTCLICKRGFAAQSFLRGHMDKHNRVKPHKCEQCDRRFARAAHLRNHMDMHNGVKAHKCEKCDRRFTQASNLSRHMNIHNGVKAHKCEQCDRRFTQAAYLHSHMNIHKRKLSYKCDECDKQFVFRRTLMAHQSAHQRIHTANSCTICGKAFDTSIALKIHLRFHNIVKKRENEESEGIA